MTSLPIAGGGCCAGHGCDDCGTCRRGHCCRKDNPNYELPKLGDWDGLVYGSFGVFESDGDTVRCHACGFWLSTLAQHTLLIHDITAREYKSMFGLSQGTPLVSPRILARLSETSRAVYEAGGNGLDPGCHKWRSTATPEQFLDAYEKRRYTGIAVKRLAGVR